MKGFVDFYTRNTRQVAAAIDQTEFVLRENMGPLDALFPITSYPSTSLLLAKMKGNITVASLVAPGQELPNDPGQFQLTEEIIKSTIIGKQHVFTAKEYAMLRDLRLQLASGGPQATVIIQAIERELFGIAAEMPMSINAKHLVLLMEVMATGELDYYDPLTRFTVQMEFNDRVSALFPAALAGNDRWSQPTTAEGLDDLEKLAEEWRKIHGMKPRGMLIHQRDLRKLSQQDYTKEALGAISGTDSTLAPALYLGTNYDATSLQLQPGPLLDLIRERSGVERVLVIDRQYTERNIEGVVSNREYLNNHTIVFFDDDGRYERARVPFTENNDAPGVIVRPKELDDMPKKERLAGMTAGMPFVPDGRYLCAQVIDGAS